MAAIKALSLWQPWASLIAWGEKKYETRGWPTSYRGLIAIHAAKRKPTSDDVAHMKEIFYAACRQNQRTDDYGLSSLPLGAVLCVCKLKDVYHTEQVAPHLSTKERAFGDYSSGRAAWALEIVRVFERPIPVKGAQGLWDWTPPEGITV